MPRNRKHAGREEPGDQPEPLVDREELDEATYAAAVEEVVQRHIHAVDPRMLCHQGDGSIYDGPVIDVAYYVVEHGEPVSRLIINQAVPEQEQRLKLHHLMQALAEEGLPVKYTDQDSGANWANLEVSLDPEYHDRVMTTVAKSVYAHGVEAGQALARQLGLHVGQPPEPEA